VSQTRATPLGRAVGPNIPLGPQIGRHRPKTATRLGWPLAMLLGPATCCGHYPRATSTTPILLRIDALVPGEDRHDRATGAALACLCQSAQSHLSILELQAPGHHRRLRISKFFRRQRFTLHGLAEVPRDAVTPPGPAPGGQWVGQGNALRSQPADPLSKCSKPPMPRCAPPESDRLLPVYGLPKGPHRRSPTPGGGSVLPAAAPGGSLPAACASARVEIDRPQALQGIQRPQTAAAQGQPHRLVFDELLLLQLNCCNGGQNRSALPPKPLVLPASQGKPWWRLPGLLPLPLTSAQQRVLAEIRADLRQEQAMARLLQRRRGSGKTVVATRPCSPHRAGCPGCPDGFPPRVLAQQHARSWRMAAPDDISPALLTGSTPRGRAARNCCRIWPTVSF